MHLNTYIPTKAALLGTLVGLIVFCTAQAQVIVIDPGHGYTTSGGNPDGRTDTEIATALSVGLKLRSLINSRCSGWTVHMTRTTRNGWVSVNQRSAMSNSWRGDRFISIHCNGGGGTGTETFWSRSSNSPNSSNIAFSTEIQKWMVDKGQWFSRRVSEDRPYLGYTLGVLRSNNAIGCLNEIGFVDSGDKTKLLNDTWRNRFADAYYEALRKSLGGNCSGGGGGNPPGGDTVAPTTAISTTGGTVKQGNFTVNYTDKDNVAVTRRYYQVLEKYGANWYANRGNGFFNDNCSAFYTGYTKGSGTWTASGGHLRQTNTSSTNTSLSSFLSQTSGLPYLYEFSAKVESTSGPKKFGLHIMASDATQSERGNSYLVWFNASTSQVIVYETINNQLNTRATASVSIDNNWANYKVTYSPGFGVLQVFRNNRPILRWTDSSPIKQGSSISLRTNATSMRFDDIKVYKFRDGASTLIKAGSAVTNDLRTASGKIKSLVRDEAGNWSTPGNLDVSLNLSTFSTMGNPGSSSLDRLRIYPNPTDGAALVLEYQASGQTKTIIDVLDYTGKTLGTKIDEPAYEAYRSVDIRGLFENLKPGYYFVRVKHGEAVNTTRVVKQ